MAQQNTRGLACTLSKAQAIVSPECPWLETVLGTRLVPARRMHKRSRKNSRADHAPMLKSPPSRVLESPPAEATLGPAPAPALPDRTAPADFQVGAESPGHRLPLIGHEGRGAATGNLRPTSRGRPAPPHPSARVTTAPRSTRRPQARLLAGPAPGGETPGGRRK